MPKVLHRLGGRALVQHVIDSAHQLAARHIIAITGHGAEQVEAALAGQAGLRFARQMPQLGTGHAVQQAMPLLEDDGVTLVLSGDVPLTQVATLQALLQACQGKQLALLTLQTAQPTGYGRFDGFDAWRLHLFAESMPQYDQFANVDCVQTQLTELFNRGLIRKFDDVVGSHLYFFVESETDLDRDACQKTEQSDARKSPVGRDFES